jgi:hypothetical protein
MAGETALSKIRAITAENPYTGTAEQIVALSIGIVEASGALARSTFSLYKDETGIGDKIFSKLRVIGKTIQALTNDERRDVIKALPPSYSTIHQLCSLTAAELVTGARSGAISPSMSVRSAGEYVKQVRFPTYRATDGEKGRWGIKQEHLFAIYRPEDVLLTDVQRQSLEAALRSVCKDYEVLLRDAQAHNASTTSLRRQEREKRELYWRKILEKELTASWFQNTPEDVRKRFNIRTINELHETPLRSFTGFIINADGGRKEFWVKHGKAYLAKVNVLMEKTDDRAQRHNLKRRIEEVLDNHRELVEWSNHFTRESDLDHA